MQVSNRSGDCWTEHPKNEKSGAGESSGTGRESGEPGTNHLDSPSDKLRAPRTEACLSLDSTYAATCPHALRSGRRGSPRLLNVDRSW